MCWIFSLSDNKEAFLSVTIIVKNVPMELNIKLNWKSVVLYSLYIAANIDGKINPIKKEAHAMNVIKSNLNNLNYFYFLLIKSCLK